MPHFSPLADGVDIHLLRRHADRGLTFLIRMRAGAHAPHHDHPGGEETYVLRGQLRIIHRRSPTGSPLPDAVISAGDYLYAPPGETHSGIAEADDTLFFVVAAGGVVPTDLNRDA